MTADTILMYHISSGLMNKNYLWFKPEGKHGCVAHSVFGLKKVFVENVVVRYMAIVAIGVFAVRTVPPGGILRRHNMAIDTGFRLIR
jgi:hypothetical protein